MDKIGLAKMIVGNVAGFGVGTILTKVIANNAEPENIREKITMIAGAVAITGIVRKAAMEYTEKQIDECVDFYNEHIKPRLNK